MAFTKVNKIEKVRLNPGTFIAAYIKESKLVDPTVIRKIVQEFARGGKPVKLDNGENVHKVIQKNGGFFYTDDAGKTALGF